MKKRYLEYRVYLRNKVYYTDNIDHINTRSKLASYIKDKFNLKNVKLIDKNWHNSDYSFIETYKGNKYRGDFRICDYGLIESKGV